MSTQYTPGKGLAALLGDIAEKANTISQGGGQSTIEAPLDRKIALTLIKAGKQQPRQQFDHEKLDDLIHSIRDNGVLQPIVVRALEKEDPKGCLYEIIAGERRYRASIQAGLQTIPAIVIHCDDIKALEIGLIENLQRDDLNPMDEAEAFLKLSKEYGKTQEEIAKAVSKSRSHVANQIRLTTLPESVKGFIRNKQLTPGHARNLVGNPDAEKIAEQIVHNKMNVREVEQVRKQHNTPFPAQGSVYPKRHKDPKVESDDVLMLQDKLSEHLNMRVKISTHDTGGSVVIYFNSFDQLDELIQKLDS